MKKQIAGFVLKGSLRHKKIPEAIEIHHKKSSTGQMLKEAAFQLFENECNDWSKVTFIDLYCGSAQIAIEAISRGCKNCYAIELNPTRVKNIRTWASSQAIESLQVHRADSLRWLKKKLITETEILFVFADPPYSFDDPYLEILRAFQEHLQMNQQYRRALLLIQAPLNRHRKVTLESKDISFTNSYAYRKNQILLFRQQFQVNKSPRTAVLE